MLKRFFRRAWTAEDGAVTVDWVVLVAAVFTVGAVIVSSVSTGAETMADATGDNLANAVVPTVSF